MLYSQLSACVEKTTTRYCGHELGTRLLNLEANFLICVHIGSLVTC